MWKQPSWLMFKNGVFKLIDAFYTNSVTTTYCRELDYPSGD